ncbi:MAG TPA: menaquinol oxidoreductase [Deltaproteobacteria bacterium]|nr:menaquinol oxidoreductase [Deltaproteobacteria bacterium]
MTGAAYALIAVIILVLVPWAGVGGLGLTFFFGVVIPYAAFTLFFFGFLRRILGWSRIPNPFRIPTTGGQQKFLDWIRQSRLDNPSSTGQVMGRMLSEVFLFRSLFRNLSSRPGSDGAGVTYASAKWLWLFAMVFHYAMFITLIRHLRFFTNPVPSVVGLVEEIDGWLEVGVPQIMISGLFLLCAVCLLLARRLLIPRLRYISLMNDFFPLFLIITIAFTGILMRYVVGIDVTSVKELVMGLVSFRPVTVEGINPLFFIHIFLVSVLFACFPFSKLMHAGGVFFSPTRNMANNNRAIHHENPWNYPVRFHTYQAFEEEFRQKMVEAGIPLNETPSPPGKKE